MLVMKNKVLDKWLIFACLCFSLRSNGAKCPASSGCRWVSLFFLLPDSF